MTTILTTVVYDIYWYDHVILAGFIKQPQIKSRELL